MLTSVAALCACKYYYALSDSGMLEFYIHFYNNTHKKQISFSLFFFSNDKKYAEKLFNIKSADHLKFHKFILLGDKKSRFLRGSF